MMANQAAVRAGYKHPDIGRRIVTKSHVQEAIQRTRKKLSKKHYLYVLDTGC